MSFNDYWKAKAAKRRKAWAATSKRFADEHAQQVQQKSYRNPTPLTHSTLNTKVATKQQNSFNPVDENKKQHDGTEKNSLIRVITLIIKSTDSFSCIAKQCNPCNLVDNKKHRKNSAITSIELTKI